MGLLVVCTQMQRVPIGETSGEASQARDDMTNFLHLGENVSIL